MMFNQHSYLYVEDDALSRDVMRMLLQDVMGVKQVFIFENSECFMEHVRELPVKPDLIFLDIHVKPMDGYTMLNSLRADPAYAHQKVIALTASVMNEEIEKLRQAGFDGAIAKPLNVRTFPGLIARIFADEVIWNIV
jgi:CheY-like chemotaxis protein